MSYRGLRCFWAVVFAVTMTGCTGNGQSPKIMPKKKMNAESGSARLARILALGDSYTIGESVEDSDRWPVILARLLRGEAIQVAEPVIVARTGWTTAELSAAMDEALDESKLKPPYDLVTLLIGVNNQYRGRDRKEFRQQFREILNRAIQLAGNDPKRVIVLSIPDYGVTPFAEGRDRKKIGKEIDQFNDVKQDESKKSGVHYVDNTVVSRRAAKDTKLVANDGLHPSGKLYRAWAENTLPIARAILR